MHALDRTAGGGVFGRAGAVAHRDRQGMVGPLDVEAIELGRHRGGAEVGEHRMRLPPVVQQVRRADASDAHVDLIAGHHGHHHLLERGTDLLGDGQRHRHDAAAGMGIAGHVVVLEAVTVGGVEVGRIGGVHLRALGRDDRAAGTRLAQETAHLARPGQLRRAELDRELVLDQRLGGVECLAVDVLDAEADHELRHGAFEGRGFVVHGVFKEEDQVGQGGGSSSRPARCCTLCIMRRNRQVGITQGIRVKGSLRMWQQVTTPA